MSIDSGWRPAANAGSALLTAELTRLKTDLSVLRSLHCENDRASQNIHSSKGKR